MLGFQITDFFDYAKHLHLSVGATQSYDLFMTNISNRYTPPKKTQFNLFKYLYTKKARLFTNLKKQNDYCWAPRVPNNNQQTMTEFESHRVPHTFGLVPYLK